MNGSETDAALLRSNPTAEDFRQPIEFIEAEHVRQVRVQEVFLQGGGLLPLGELAKQAADLLHFLVVDLTLHHADEEEGLFPILVKRSLPEDKITRVLAQLAREHELDIDLIEFVCADLEKLAAGLGLANSTRFQMNLSELFDSQRHHLQQENRIVLPLARRRLTADDLAVLGRAMAARRGLPLVEPLGVSIQ